jgi:hypothetical protein
MGGSTRKLVEPNGAKPRHQSPHFTPQSTETKPFTDKSLRRGGPGGIKHLRGAKRPLAMRLRERVQQAQVVASTKPVACPFCGKGPIQLDAKVCDNCGKDLATFWKTYNFLEKQPSLRKPVQQMPMGEQPRTEKVPMERMAPVTSLPPSVPQPKPEAIATRTIHESTKPTGKSQLTRIRLVALAVALVAIVAVGLIASVWLGLIPSPFQTGTPQGSTCTITGAGTCQIGSLYIGKLIVTNSSYNGNQTLDIRFTVNDTGAAPLNITAVTFDNAPVQAGPALAGNLTFSAFWWSTSNAKGTPTQVIGKVNATIILEVPWTQLQHETTPPSGVHTVRLVDSSGTSYAFSFTGTLNVP